MKYLTCAFSLLFLLLSNVVSAGLVSWTSQYFSPSRYPSMSTRPNINFIDFTHGKSILSIEEVQITPKNAKPGDELIVGLKAYLGETVDSGAFVEVDLFVGSEDPIKKVYNICSLLRDNSDKIDLTCPIEEREINLTQIIRLRETIPKEAIHIRVKAYTSRRDILAHFVIYADFSSYNSNEYLDFGK